MGHRGRFRVRILVVDCDLEALTIRGAIEEMTALNTDVVLWPAATSYQLTDALCLSRDQADHVIICCHGDGEGILFEEVVPEALGGRPFEAKVGPEQVSARARLDSQVVVCTGCGLGRQEMAEAFLEAGAAAYLAARDDPQGSAVTPFLTLFYYNLLAGGQPPDQAVERARNYCQGMSVFRLWQRPTAGDLGRAEGGA